MQMGKEKKLGKREKPGKTMAIGPSGSGPQGTQGDSSSPNIVDA